MQRHSTSGNEQPDAVTHVVNLNEVHCVVAVVVDSGACRENVRVENNVGRGDAHLLSKHIKTTLADIDLSMIGMGLTVFIQSHNNHSRTIELAASAQFNKG